MCSLQKTHTELSTWKVPYNGWKQLFWIKIIVWIEDKGKWSNSGRFPWPRLFPWPRFLEVGFAVAETGGFESRRGRGCVLRVECCQVEVSATGWSLVQWRSTDCVCVCVSLSNQVQQNPFTPKETRKEKKKGTNHLLLMKYLSRHKTHIFYTISLCNFVVPTRSVW